MANVFEGHVVEEQVLRLLLDLNPAVKDRARDVAQGTTLIDDDAILQAARGGVAEDDEQGTATNGTSEPGSASTEERVRRLLSRIPAPHVKVSASLRERLLRLLNRYCPHRIPHAVTMLRQYRGCEETLFASLVHQYGGEPTMQDPDYFHESIPPLPAGWTRVVSETRGDVLYLHESSGKRQWNRPGLAI